MNGLKKTALLLSGLDFSAVDKLLSVLGADESRAIRREMLSLKHSDIADSGSIDNEFIRQVSGRVSVPAEKNNVPVTGKNPAEYKAVSLTYSPPKPKYDQSAFMDKPFAFLADWPDDEIVTVLQKEHPQVMTAVLANLPQSRAKRILADLPAILQLDITERLTHYEPPSAVAVEEIEALLQQRAGHTAQRSIPWCSQLRHLPDAQLSMVFHSVDLRTALIALIGADAKFIERVTKRFSPTEEHEMRRMVRGLGSVRDEHIAAAREKIIAVLNV